MAQNKSESRIYIENGYMVFLYSLYTLPGRLTLTKDELLDKCRDALLSLLGDNYFGRSAEHRKRVDVHLKYLNSICDIAHTFPDGANITHCELFDKMSHFRQAD